jgi:hypothetical protein
VIRAALAASALTFVLGAVPAQGAPRVTCSTKSLATSGGYRITRLQATHASCTKARSVARRVASQLGKGGTVHVPGVAGFAMATQSCSGCGTTTRVTLTWPSGMEIVVSLRTGSTGSLNPPPQQAPGSGPPTTI